jgi:hypothetical protein
MLVFTVADVTKAVRLYRELAAYTGHPGDIRDDHPDANGVVFHVSTCGLASFEDLYRFLMDTFGEIPGWILRWQQVDDETDPSKGGKV